MLWWPLCLCGISIAKGRGPGHHSYPWTTHPFMEEMSLLYRQTCSPSWQGGGPCPCPHSPPHPTTVWPGYKQY